MKSRQVLSSSAQRAYSAAIPARSFQEPRESDRLIRANDALEQLEDGIRDILAASGKSALHQRLGKLRPDYSKDNA